MNKLGEIGNSWGGWGDWTGGAKQVDALVRSCFDAFEELFLVSVRLDKSILLTHFEPVFPFTTLWNPQRTIRKILWSFHGGRELEHLLKIVCLMILCSMLISCYYFRNMGVSAIKSNDFELFTSKSQSDDKSNDFAQHYITTQWQEFSREDELDHHSDAKDIIGKLTC